LTEGVTAARVESHRIRHLVERALKVVDRSKYKDHIYQVAGDVITTMPRRVEVLEEVLDRLSYALAVFGKDHLRDRLPISDRALVDDAAHKAKPFTAPSLTRSTSRVALRYLDKLAGDRDQ
jgi:hypothetical protein